MAVASLELQGVMAALVTPFHEDESLDVDRLATHIEDMLEAGITGIMITGGSGEYVNLTPDERKTVASETVQIVHGRCPVIVGMLAPSTRETLDYGEHAARAGADALLVPPPYYIKPSFDGVRTHFEQVAGLGLPMILYNIPSRTGWSLELEHLHELADVPGVVAVKECERDMAVISGKMAGMRDRLSMLSGDDDLGLFMFLLGAPGAIVAAANLCPRLCVALFKAAKSGNLRRARALHERLLTVFNSWMGPNHPGPLKEAMQMAGRSAGPGRRPLSPVSVAQAQRIRAALTALEPSL